jgi:TRAP-type C4-dicarboxylate transport system permease large subunit
MHALLQFSNGIRRLLEVVAHAAGGLLVVMAALTCCDVLARKTGLPVPLTKLQELEWHLHAAIFSLWMGYGYVIKAHPRVDSFTEKLPLRRKAWIELVGCVLLALPYVALIAALNRRLTATMLQEAVLSACRSNGLVFLIFLGTTGFSYVLRVLGGDELMIAMLFQFGIDTQWERLTFVMILIFLLGFPFEWLEICLIVLPVFAPIMLRYDFSDHMVDKGALMTWFGGLMAVNLQTAFMTPPFGATLFYMQGTAPPEVTMTDVYRGMYPFVVMQVIGLGLCIYFLSLILWLPRLPGFLD